MPKANLSEQLDRAIQVLLAPSATARSRRDGAAPKAPVAALARIAGELFDYLDAPVRRVAALDTPVPYSPDLEEAALPQSSDILEALLEITKY